MGRERGGVWKGIKMEYFGSVILARERAVKTEDGERGCVERGRGVGKRGVGLCRMERREREGTQGWGGRVSEKEEGGEGEGRKECTGREGREGKEGGGEGSRVARGESGHNVGRERGERKESMH